MDFHYHAGNERNDKSLYDHLVHARVTNRRLLGVTDHFGYYLPSSKKADPIYPPSFDGLHQYYNELMSYKNDFPEITFYFAPEIGPDTDFSEVTDAVIRISDYFICEPNEVTGTFEENTEILLKKVEAVAAFSASCKKPAFIAHPLRSSVNLRLVRNPIIREITEMEARLSYKDYSETEVNEFFLFDIKKFAQKAARCDVPIEINGCTVNRIKTTNLIAPWQMYLAAYEIMRDEGVSFIPSSDQHDFRTGIRGHYIPYECFDALGIKAEDIDFVKRINDTANK